MSKLSLKQKVLSYIFVAAALFMLATWWVVTFFLRDDVVHRNAIVLAVLILAIATYLTVSTIVNIFVIKRINIVRGVIDSISSSGDLSRRVGDSGNDEISALAQSFDSLMVLREDAALQIEESERKYQTLADAVPVGIFRCAPDGSCVYVNRQHCQMTGLAPAEVYGKDWVNFFHPDDRPYLLEKYKEHRETHVPLRETLRIVRKNGEILWCLILSSVEYACGDMVKGYVGTVMDVTVSKKIEIDREVTRAAGEQVNKSKSAFQANMSHELLAH